MRGHTILLGSVGGDSHSVGLNILRQALMEDGYKVRYLGTHNQLRDFFQYASLTNVVMISNMDGHAWHYLREFPKLTQQYHILPNTPLWYLGGNISLGDAVGDEFRYVEMGFDRVFVKFVDVMTIMKLLRQDLHDTEPLGENPRLWEEMHSVPHQFSSLPSQTKVAVYDLEKDRNEVLQHWRTGREARSLDENAEFLVRQPSFPMIQNRVNQGALPMLIQPRSGVALVDEQINLFKAFKSVGVPVLSYQVDSMTRNNDYRGAAVAVKGSIMPNHSLLNGFPVVNHGVSQLRRIISEVRVPLQVRHSTRDPRLLAEVSYAGGATAFEGGAICYNIPYYKDYTLHESLRMWQYVDRLTGLYHERYGIILDREFFGTLTGTLIPPSLAIATGILESLLAIQQGVKCVSLGYAEQGNRIQDIAAIRTMAAMASETFHNMGYDDIQINTVFHQYMAAFPWDVDRSKSLIFNSAITAGLSRATRVMTKSPVEPFKIPSMTDNLEGIALVMAGISKSDNGIRKPDETLIAEECAIIREEVEAILDSIIYAGHGDIIKGIVIGFEKGYLDIPFAPSIHNAGKVVTARDAQGAVRFVSPGNLKFGRDLLEFHRDKISERRHKENIFQASQNYLLVEKDVLQIARCQYQGWPLFE